MATSRSHNGITKTIAVFDIDSASIGAALINYHFTRDGKHLDTEFMYQKRMDIDLLHELPLDEFFRRSHDTLQTLAEDMRDAHVGTPTEIYCNVSAPWASSQRRETTYNKESDFTLTKELVNKIIDQELELPLKRNLDFAVYDDLKIIERRTLDVYINGYPTLHPYGQKMRTVEIHSLISVMSEVSYNAFEHIFQKVFMVEPNFFSNTAMSYISFKDILPHEDNALFIDISGEVTELLVIQDDHLKQIAIFPLGAHNVVRHIKNKKSISYSQAVSLMRMYHDERAHDDHKTEHEELMDEAFTVWLRGLYETLDRITEQGLVPDIICLSAPENIMYWFAEHMLIAEELTEHMHTTGSIKLINLDHTMNDGKLKAHFHESNNNYDFDSALYLASQFILSVYDHA